MGFITVSSDIKNSFAIKIHNYVTWLMGYKTSINFLSNYKLLTQVLTDLSLTTTSGIAYFPSLAVF